MEKFLLGSAVKTYSRQSRTSKYYRPSIVSGKWNDENDHIFDQLIANEQNEQENNDLQWNVRNKLKCVKSDFNNKKNSKCSMTNSNYKTEHTKYGSGIPCKPNRKVVKCKRGTKKKLTGISDDSHNELHNTNKPCSKKRSRMKKKKSKFRRRQPYSKLGPFHEKKKSASHNPNLDNKLPPHLMKYLNEDFTKKETYVLQFSDSNKPHNKCNLVSLFSTPKLAQHNVSQKPHTKNTIMISAENSFAFNDTKMCNKGEISFNFEEITAFEPNIISTPENNVNMSNNCSLILCSNNLKEALNIKPSCHIRNKSLETTSRIFNNNTFLCSKSTSNCSANDAYDKSDKVLLDKQNGCNTGYSTNVSETDLSSKTNNFSVKYYQVNLSVVVSKKKNSYKSMNSITSCSHLNHSGGKIETPVINRSQKTYKFAHSNVDQLFDHKINISQGKKWNKNCRKKINFTIVSDSFEDLQDHTQSDSNECHKNGNLKTLDKHKISNNDGEMVENEISNDLNNENNTSEISQMIELKKITPVLEKLYCQKPIEVQKVFGSDIIQYDRRHGMKFKNLIYDEISKEKKLSSNNSVDLKIMCNEVTVLGRSSYSTPELQKSHRNPSKQFYSKELEQMCNENFLFEKSSCNAMCVKLSYNEILELDNSTSNEIPNSEKSYIMISNSEKVINDIPYSKKVYNTSPKLEKAYMTPNLEKSCNKTPSSEIACKKSNSCKKTLNTEASNLGKTYNETFNSDIAYNEMSTLNIAYRETSTEKSAKNESPEFKKSAINEILEKSVYDDVALMPERSSCNEILEPVKLYYDGIIKSHQTFCKIIKADDSYCELDDEFVKLSCSKTLESRKSFYKTENLNKVAELEKFKDVTELGISDETKLKMLENSSHTERIVLQNSEDYNVTCINSSSSVEVTEIEPFHIYSEIKFKKSHCYDATHSPKELSCNEMVELGKQTDGIIESKNLSLDQSIFVELLGSAKSSYTDATQLYLSNSLDDVNGENRDVIDGYSFNNHCQSKESMNSCYAELNKYDDKINRNEINCVLYPDNIPLLDTQRILCVFRPNEQTKINSKTLYNDINEYQRDAVKHSQEIILNNCITEDTNQKHILHDSIYNSKNETLFLGFDNSITNCADDTLHTIVPYQEVDDANVLNELTYNCKNKTSFSDINVSIDGSFETIVPYQDHLTISNITSFNRYRNDTSISNIESNGICSNSEVDQKNISDLRNITYRRRKEYLTPIYENYQDTVIVHEEKEKLNEFVSPLKNSCLFLPSGKKWRRSMLVLKGLRNNTINLMEETKNKGRNWLKNIEGLINFQNNGTTIDENAIHTSFTKQSLYSTLLPCQKESLFEDIFQNHTFHNSTLIDKTLIPINSETAKEVVLNRCLQKEPILFEKCFPDYILQKCRKVGEGVYGEVFSLNRNKCISSVLKIIPIEGDKLINGESQKKFEEIISEMVISSELSRLRSRTDYFTDCFCEVIQCWCVQGKYPERLIDLWNDYDTLKGSDNDCPSIFTDEQLYIVLELGNGGMDAESFVYNSAQQAFAVIKQTAFALAVAEEALQFEHRDLHWGNILVSRCTEKENTYHINNNKYTVKLNGVKVTIIDFTLSRIMYNGQTAFNNLGTDPELFTAEGDFQFEVYRLMKNEVQNLWDRFVPKTNIFWMQYLIYKMLNVAHYKRTNTRIHKSNLEILHNIYNSISNMESCFQLVTSDILY